MRNLHKGEREGGKKRKILELFFNRARGRNFSLAGSKDGVKREIKRSPITSRVTLSAYRSLLTRTKFPFFPFRRVSTIPRKCPPLPIPFHFRADLFLRSARVTRFLRAVGLTASRVSNFANWYHAIVISFVSREIPLHRYSVFLNRSFYPLIFIFRKLVKNSRMERETISISIISLPLSVMNFSRIYHGTRERSRKHGNFPANEQMDILIDYTSFWWMVGDFWSCDEIRNDGLVQIATR